MVDVVKRVWIPALNPPGGVEQEGSKFRPCIFMLQQLPKPRRLAEQGIREPVILQKQALGLVG